MKVGVVFLKKELFIIVLFAIMFLKNVLNIFNKSCETVSFLMMCIEMLNRGSAIDIR